MTGEVELSREDLLVIVDAIRQMPHTVSSGDYAHLVTAALQTAIQVTQSDGAVVYRLDGSGQTLVKASAEVGPGGVERAPDRVEVEGTWTGGTLTTLKASAAHVGSFAPATRDALRNVGIVHIATLPLQVRGRATGALNVWRRNDRPYTPRELRIGEILSDLLVVHFENARLFAEASARLDEMGMLLEVARTITATLSLGERLEASAEVLARMVDASNAFVLLLDDEKKVLRGVSSARPEWRDYIRTVTIPVDAPSIAAQAFRTRKTVVIEDAERSDDVQVELVRRFAEKSLVALPLLAGGEPIGAVVVDDTRRPRTWGSSEVERAELIVTQVATAVANARLFEAVKRSYERLAHAQEELVKRERLAALGQLAATLAHEVRNPLGVLFNSLGTLGKIMPKTGDAAVLLRIMGEEARRLDRLVRELLDFARPVTPAMEPHSLADIVDGALRAAAQELGPDCARLRSEVPPDFPRMSLDHAMMRRALVNLLVNGGQAAGSAGAVAIRSSIDTRSGQPLARIEVSDTGPGIPPAIRERVFEPFFTTKATGTGLGLAIVKSIVEAHGGRIELAPGERGIGTRVTLLLPFETEHAT